MEQIDGLQYSILDPTGNITALVESPVEPLRQPQAAARLMECHPAVEQVGFIDYEADGEADAGLRMAGGEFCGNAAMSAAALLLLHRGEPAVGESRSVRLRVSGAAAPVTVRLCREREGSFSAGVQMPPALRIERRELTADGCGDRLPVVRMEGISHVVIGTDSPCFALKAEPAAAEEAVRVWCSQLGAEGLGLMFLEETDGAYRLTPLVYVPAAGTVFWESSCASGSAAVGMALADTRRERVDLTLAEPGGRLRVESEPGGDTWLYGRASLTAEFGGDSDVRTKEEG